MSDSEPCLYDNFMTRPETQQSEKSFKCGCPKITGTFLEVPVIRIIVFWGSMLGFPYLGKLPNSHQPVQAPTLFLNPDLDHFVLNLEKQT